MLLITQNEILPSRSYSPRVHQIIIGLDVSRSLAYAMERSLCPFCVRLSTMSNAAKIGKDKHAESALVKWKTWRWLGRNLNLSW
jgi:hypothetical protein